MSESLELLSLPEEVLLKILQFLGTGTKCSYTQLKHLEKSLKFFKIKNIGLSL
jgi:hypothetical protein